MRDMKSIAIAGFGLIGGSLGKAVKRYTDYNVLAIDNDKNVLESAVNSGAADESGGAELLCKADMLILALSPAVSVDFLRENAGKLKTGALVTDVCGIKRTVVAECEKLCMNSGLYFIGGHPMAGREHSGFEYSVEDLFTGASYILTPTENTAPDAMEFMKQFAIKLGCKEVTVTTPENHDRMIAFTSQLPHVLAGAYVKSECAPEHRGYSAGSFRDVSRVATVDEKLWSQLFIDNGDLLCGEIETLIKHLNEYRQAIADNDRETLTALIKDGREIKTRI